MYTRGNFCVPDGRIVAAGPALGAHDCGRDPPGPGRSSVAQAGCARPALVVALVQLGGVIGQETVRAERADELDAGVPQAAVDEEILRALRAGCPEDLLDRHQFPPARPG